MLHATHGRLAQQGLVQNWAPVTRDSDRRRIVDAAVERGWSYESTMPALRERWSRSPFRASAGNPPFGRIGGRFGELIHVVSGIRDEQRFWAFEWVEVPLGTTVGKMIAFVSAGQDRKSVV